MRKWIAVGAVVVAALAIGPLAFAASHGPGGSATGTGGSTVKCLDFAYRTTSVSTSSTSFADVPGLEVGLASIFGQAVSANVVVAGAEVQVRAVATDAGGTRVLLPGVAQFDPTTGKTTAYSFTFVDNGESGAPHGNTIDIQWRVVHAGDTATLRRGDMTVLSEADACNFGSPA